MSPSDCPTVPLLKPAPEPSRRGPTVNHRHLLPDEIDQLVDDEIGFGTAPLKAHVAECRDCQVRLEEARAVTGLIEQLPRLAPSHRFTDRVMAQVPVFVPWHVAARDEIAK